MGYRAHLWRMLGHLGVYSQEGYSGGELGALGTGLDQAEAVIAWNAQESLVETAVREGLAGMEKIFPMEPEGSVQQRREALRTLIQTDNRCNTAAGIVETLGACGVQVTVSETGEKMQALVTLSSVLTMAEDPVFRFWAIEQVMPCHLNVICLYSYQDRSSGETMQESASLETLRARSRTQWEEKIQ